MPINIKYSLETKKISYNSFQEIEQLERYNDIVFINCSHNKLTSLPDLPNSLQKLWCQNNQLTLLPDLPDSLQELNCRNNKLTLLPDLPDSLQELNCYYNKLTSLPDLPNSLQILKCGYNKLISLPNLPDSLQKLWCQNNQLTLLPEHLPNSFQKLYCSDNQLTSLPNIPNSLQKLWCFKNKLTLLPDLPNSLQELNCSYNKLTLLPDLPKSLTQLYCDHNKLTSLPNSIIHCRNLQHINIEGNEIEYIPPHITRFLNRVKNHSKAIGIYNDRQNVHNHQIQQSIRDSIYSVVSGKPILTIDETMSEIIKSPILSEQTKRLILEYGEDPSIHSVLGIRFKELLTSVWDIIRNHTNKNDILAILNDEINDANCKCFTGRMSRLINCLNGFDDRVNITIGDNSQIGNIILLVRKKLEDENKYTVSVHKELVREELIERGYSKEVISEWIEYIE